MEFKISALLQILNFTSTMEPCYCKDLLEKYAHPNN